MNILLALLGAVLLIPLLTIYSAFCWGLVTSILWGWFIVPLFPDMPVLTWTQLIGIMCVFSCFNHRSKVAIKKEFKDDNSFWIGYLTAPWVTLISAWIIKTFI